jgi:predicted TIM-barrel fold metal-dependent hydrolase
MNSIKQIVLPHPIAADARNGIALPNDRRAQVRRGALPEGTVIVSPDDHWTVADDIFHDRFPEYLKDRAPRIFRDDRGFPDWFIEGKPLFSPAQKTLLDSFERVPGAGNMGPRMQDLDTEGVDKELAFPNAVSIFHSWPDLEVREHAYNIYNEYLAELQKEAPGRFFGVGLPVYWDMAKVRDSVQMIKDLGLKTFMLPIFPKGEKYRALNYCEPEMEPLFDAIADSGLPLCFHVGENAVEGRGGNGVSAMLNFSPFRKNLGELIFGGIFDRHPNMQVAFIEGDLNWIPGALQTAEMSYDCSPLDYHPERRPSEYWRRQCYASFMYDPIGLTMLDLIGADRVMWSHDYPHPESVWGFSWTAIQAVLDAVPADTAKRILGGTALDLFKLND